MKVRNSFGSISTFLLNKSKITSKGRKDDEWSSKRPDSLTKVSQGNNLLPKNCFHQWSGLKRCWLLPTSFPATPTYAIGLNLAHIWHSWGGGMSTSIIFCAEPRRTQYASTDCCIKCKHQLSTKTWQGKGRNPEIWGYRWLRLPKTTLLIYICFAPAFSGNSLRTLCTIFNQPPSNGLFFMLFILNWVKELLDVLVMPKWAGNSGITEWRRV